LQGPIAAVTLTFAAADAAVTAVISLRESRLPLWCVPTGAAYTLSVVLFYPAIGDGRGLVGHLGLGLITNQGLLFGVGVLSIGVHAAVTARLSREAARRTITEVERAYNSAWAAVMQRDSGGRAAAARAGASELLGGALEAGGGAAACDCGGVAGGFGGGGSKAAGAGEVDGGEDCGGELALLAATVAELSQGLPHGAALLQRTPPWPPKPLHKPPTAGELNHQDADEDGEAMGEPVGSLEQLLAQSAGLDLFLRCKAS
jgi:hypothetical protein